MYKCILFDLDGTLADTDLLVVEGFLHFFREYKKEKVTLETLASFSGPSLKESFSKHFPGYDVNELIEKFREYTWPMYDTYIELYEGMEEVLDTLKSKGFKLGIVTSKMKIATEKTLNEINIGHYFDYVISIEDVSAPKPNPEGVLKSMEFFNSSREETLFIGDAVSDLLTANNAGIDCCLVSWNLRGRHKNVNPKFYIDSPTQLLEVILNGK